MITETINMLFAVVNFLKCVVTKVLLSIVPRIICDEFGGSVSGFRMGARTICAFYKPQKPIISLVILL